MSAENIFRAAYRQNNLSQALEEKIAASRKQAVETKDIMVAISEGKALSTMAHKHKISPTTLARRIAIFGSQCMRFIQQKGLREDNLFKEISDNSSMTDAQAQQVPDILRDLLDSENKWSLKAMCDYYEVTVQELNYRITTFGVHALRSLNTNVSLPTETGLAYEEIVLDAMGKALNGMSTTTALCRAENDEEEITKARKEHFLLAHNVYPPFVGWKSKAAVADSDEH